MFPVFEAERGDGHRASPRSGGGSPVEEYLRLQARFAHLFGASPAAPTWWPHSRREADRNIARFGLLPEEES